MAVVDTHKAIEALIAAGFTECHAKALLAVGSEGLRRAGNKDRSARAGVAPKA